MRNEQKEVEAQVKAQDGFSGTEVRTDKVGTERQSEQH